MTHINENLSDDERELDMDEFIEWFVRKDRENYTKLDELFIYS